MTQSPGSPSTARPNAGAVCTYCGAEFDVFEWHPAELTDVDGDLIVCDFCDESCRISWQEER